MRTIRLASRARALAAVPCLLLAACGGASNNNNNNNGSHDMATGGSASTDMATYYMPTGFYELVPFLSPAADHDFPSADKVLDGAKDYAAVIETDEGRVVIDLLEKDTPITVNSFVFLALHHFFDGMAFHRVIDGFMAQTGDPNSIDGDPSSWGTGGPGYYFGLEIVNGLNYDKAGMVGMARTANPNTNGSQFFITFAAAHNLDGMYTIFGKQIEGQAVLPNIVRGPMAQNGAVLPPLVATRIVRVYIVAK